MNRYIVRNFDDYEISEQGFWVKAQDVALDNEELERLCKICVENGISTGHADTLAEFAGECVTNLLEMKASQVLF